MRIGQLSSRTGVSTKAIRYYEDIGVLRQAQREDNGYRVYDARDVERLVFIKDAQAAGLSLDEIGHILALKAKGMPTCEHVRAMLERGLADITERIAMLETARAELERLTVRARDLDPEQCIDPDRCQAIGSTESTVIPAALSHG
jgi:DNA-binding transcriptional MerR regulator